MRRLSVGGGQDCPCFTGCFGLCNKWYDGVGDGANDCIQDQLVLSDPKVMSRVGSGCVIMCESG